MGKRSSFDRIERDFYPTPLEAVGPLVHHLKPGTTFSEPCCGDGALVYALEAAGMPCVEALDVEPQCDFGLRMDAFEWTAHHASECIVTNPPWSRPILHRMIVHFSDQRPTWLLFDAGWIHTRQAVPYLPRLRRIISVGRVKWIKDSPFTGKDNCAWHLFTRPENRPAEFYGRRA